MNIRLVGGGWLNLALVQKATSELLRYHNLMAWDPVLALQLACIEDGELRLEDSENE
jgi:hypothetical protein